MNKHTIDKEDLDYLKKLAIRALDMESMIVDRIIDLESRHDPEDEDDYMDEAEQAEMFCLCDVLGRRLTDEEEERVEVMRTAYLGGDADTIDQANDNDWPKRLRQELDSGKLKEEEIERIRKMQ